MESKKVFSNQSEYESWLNENKEKAMEYFVKNDIDLRDVSMNTRAYNALRISGKNKMSDIIFFSNSEIYNIEMMSRADANEVLMLIRNYLRKHKNNLIDYVLNEQKQEVSKAEEPEKQNNDLEQVPFYVDVNALLFDETLKEKIIEFFELMSVELCDLNLSVRSYNALRRNNIDFLHEAISYYPNGFEKIHNIGRKSIDEICSVIENYVSKNYLQIKSYINGGEVVIKQVEEAELDPYKLSVLELIKHPDFKEKASEYIKENDISIEMMGLGNRSTNALLGANLLSLYDVLSIYPSDLSKLKNLGEKSINEIKNKVEYYLLKMRDSVAAYCNDDFDALYSDEYITQTIIDCFKNIDYKGLSFTEIKGNLPEKIDENRIKKSIGRLIADKQLEYVDFRLYRVHPSVYTVIEEVLLDEKKDVLLKKYAGMTLEAIAKELNVTRERIRQKIDKCSSKLKGYLRNKYDVSCFDEDYYEYLYSNYEVNKELWLDFLDVPEKTFGYLISAFKKGATSIEVALNDPKVDLNLKYRIQEYLNKDKILLDGELVNYKRCDVENYILSKVCIDELTYDEFVEKHNEFLKNNNIAFDEKIYITEEVKRTRTNHLADSKLCLWKQGEKLRYYDINSNDYEEFLETINLKGYKDTEISTLKFFVDYPDIMTKYDIRDQYELHNLLKKIIDPNEYNNIHFSRQPSIKFGEFDRDKTIYETMVALSPVSAEDLAEYLYLEYGFNKATSQATYFQKINKYYHNGVYSVDFKNIPSDRVDIFKSRLTEDFYYISEIKKIYKETFGDVDLEEINPRSLKSMGFIVFSNYAIQNFQTADSYFAHILTSQDVYDISTLNGKFMNLQIYYNRYLDLRQNYDIFLFDKNQAITMNRLSKLGITKEDIKKFCDDVVEFAEEGTCFTMHSLREAGFVSKLDDLGFDDYFYAGILAMDPRFMWQHVFGVIVLSLKTGRSEEIISKKSFLIYALSKYDSVDLDDFISDCLEEYGINISDRYEITRAIAGTDMYYDSIMAKVYRNKNCYYAEFDD